MITEEIESSLFSLADKEYAAFQAKLMPTVDASRIIGVRIPDIRKLAKEYAKREDVGVFLDTLPHAYYDEDCLHGLIAASLKNYDECVSRLDAFLPYVDNWAACDIITPKVFAKNTDKLELKIDEWLASPHTYAVRFGIEMYMNFFLDEKFSVTQAEKVARIRSDEYYINMMIAWYFATALAKQYESAVGFIENKKLDVWTHNMTIRKACESYRVPDERKEYLKGLKSAKKS